MQIHRRITVRCNKALYRSQEWLLVTFWRYQYTVFIAASAALIVASAIGVLAGALLSEYINEKYLHYIAGAGFIGIGVYTLYNA